MNKTKMWLFLFGAISFAMHLYPFWMVEVFSLKHPLGFWKDSLPEIAVNLLCAFSAQIIIFRRIGKNLSFPIGILTVLNVVNIVIGFQIYALFSLIVDAWSVLFSLLLKKRSKNRMPESKNSSPKTPLFGQ